jgi:predicted MFS family arabinose efflux permease
MHHLSERHRGRPRRRVVRGLLVDVTPLRESREFRVLWCGQLVNAIGSQLTVVAVPYQVYELTGSTFQVGLVSLVQLGPLIVCSMLGGALADAADRRKVLLLMQVLMGLGAGGLVLNAAMQRPALWPIYMLSAASAGLSGFEGPARRAAIVSTVRREHLASAFALNQSLQQTASVVGPACAGVLIGVVGLPVVFLVDMCTFALSAVFVFRLRPMPPQGGGTRFGFASVREGLTYLSGHRVLQAAFLADINAMVFGMPRALFPALGTSFFGGGPATVGLLYAAPGAGALVGALTTGWVGRVRRQGLAVLVAVAAWGLAVASVGVVPWLPLALVMLAVAGAADVVSAVFRGALVQLAVPDRLRGRLSAINMTVVAGGPRLGDARAGTVASLGGPQLSVASGGILCVIGVVVLARAYPQLARWTLADAVDEEESSSGVIEAQSA